MLVMKGFLILIRTAMREMFLFLLDNKPERVLLNLNKSDWNNSGGIVSLYIELKICSKALSIN